MPTISKGLKQAYDLQDLTFAAAKKMGEALSLCEKLSREDANALAQLVRAWESCQERIRIHRNRPMPGSRRPVPEKEKPSKARKPSGMMATTGFPPVHQPTAKPVMAIPGLQPSARVE